MFKLSTQFFGRVDLFILSNIVQFNWTTQASKLAHYADPVYTDFESCSEVTTYRMSKTEESLTFGELQEQIKKDVQRTNTFKYQGHWLKESERYYLELKSLFMFTNFLHRNILNLFRLSSYLGSLNIKFSLYFDPLKIIAM